MFTSPSIEILDIANDGYGHHIKFNQETISGKLQPRATFMGTMHWHF